MMCGKKLLLVDSFYAMFTPRQVQQFLGCSRATLYRTLRMARIERYYLPNHPGSKYIWGCSLYKLLGTPAGMKVVKKFGNHKLLLDIEDIELMNKMGVPKECVIPSINFGLIPVKENKIPWWYEKAIKGLLVLPLPYK